MSTTTRKPKWWLAFSTSLLFFFTGLIFLPYPGIQNDEALLASPVFQILDSLYHFRLFHHDVPVMLMTYLGALKTWIYALIFQIFEPSPYSVRLPGLLAGSATVWIFYLMLRRIHGALAAFIGALLLATDTMFLLTSCFDWGPVALQHLLSCSGLLFTLRYYERKNRLNLMLAGFFFGLALWDKALFLWLLGGLLLAALLLFGRQLWLRTPLRDLAFATLAFSLGALPLLCYNVTQGYPTFHATHGFTTEEVYGKSIVLRGTWEGAGLLGYIVKEDSAPLPRAPKSQLERLAFQVRAVAGEHRRNALNWGFLAFLFCLPFVWRTPVRNPILFCLIAFLVGWLQMALTRGAGGAVHHVVLLWPLPHACLALAFAETARRTGRIGTSVFLIGTFLLALTNLLTTNQYLYQFARNGSDGSWTDAIYALSANIEAEHPSRVAIIDWGMVDSLDLLNRNRLAISWQGDSFQPVSPGQRPPSPDPRLLDDPQVLWLAHTDGNEQFPGVNAGVTLFTKREGYAKLPAKTYYDGNGRPIFQTFRLRKLQTGQ